MNKKESIGYNGAQTNNNNQVLFKKSHNYFSGVKINPAVGLRIAVDLQKEMTE